MHDLINHIRGKIKDDGEDISHYVSKPGTQYGSNPGGVMRDPHTNDEHYVKFYKNHDQARSEVAAAKVYEAVGANTLKPRLVRYKGQLGVAAKWQNLRALGPEGYHHQEHETYGEQDHHELARHFHAAVLTKNWDTVGLEHDNLKKTKDGKLTTVDAGGSFKYRAMGGPKEYGADIKEHSSLRDGTNHQSKAAFGGLKHEHFASHKDTLNSLTHENVHRIFKEAGVDSPEEHTANLLSRRDKIVEKL